MYPVLVQKVFPDWYVTFVTVHYRWDVRHVLDYVSCVLTLASLYSAPCDAGGTVLVQTLHAVDII